MDQHTEEVSEKKDYSRPYFPRKYGEVGLYFDVDDMECVDAHAYGSEQLMRVEANEKLGQYLATRDLVKVKGELERTGHFPGIILEEFRRGGILAVIFNEMADLVTLWKLHEKKGLSSLFQTFLVDPAMLRELGLRKLSLRVRVWQDELEACREEMRKMAKEPERVDINSRPRDLAILWRVRQFQKEQNTTKVQQLHDRAAEFELHLSEFLLVAKQHLPHKINEIPSLEFFQNNMAAGLTSKRVTEYLAILDLLRAMVTQAEVNVHLPLMCIPARCETMKQRDLKKQIKSVCEEMKNLLDLSSNLRKCYYKKWESKALLRERSLFMGLISLVPLGVEKITDVDGLLDEYVTGFPSEL